jgi:pimeloyl-ACP methyl ester carboxylesterase
MIVKLAVDNPNMFSGLVLIAAALDPAAEKPERWRPAFYKTILKYLMPGAWRISNEEIWYLKTELKDLEKRLKEVTCPIVILHGDKDGLVDVSNAPYAKKMFINSKHVSMTIIHGANHFVSDHHFELVKGVFMNMDTE